MPPRRAKPAVPTAVSGVPESPLAGLVDLFPPELFLNRELTWLEFNRRVLHEAEDPRTPLLERVKFIAIVSGNLDEFFMKRIGGLKQQVGAGMNNLTVDGRTPRQQIEECYARVRELEARKRDLFADLAALLREAGIAIVSYAELSAREKKGLRTSFHRNIYPLVTPQSIDPAHPFPFISNLSLNLLVSLRYPKDREVSLARVKVPVGAGIPRFIRVGEGDRFVPLEEVMCHSLDLVFPEMEVVSCAFFRVTRNANTERNEEQADDLLAMIESELQDRRFAPIVRLEIGPGMDPVHRGMLAAELALDEAADVFEKEGMLALRDLFEIATLDHPALRDLPHHAIDHPRLQSRRNIFHIIRDAGSILLQHPYESFATSVERFLQEAAEDPKVRAIKMTLYRTASEGRIVDCLMDAANNGKQVAVVVELKARFDEAANIRLAERMEEAGIHVTYGVVGLKTHCKVILVVRQDYTGLRRYVHIGTGNYHATTARVYEDVGIFTADPEIAADIADLFNFVTGFGRPQRFRKLLVAPFNLRKRLIEHIREVAAAAEAGKHARIRLKCNSLTHVDVIEELYEASRAGAEIDVVVRANCTLVPGVPGMSETIRVRSILGRFLEHSRLYCFEAGDEKRYLLGSADLMPRNLDHRIEVILPVEDGHARNEIESIFKALLADNAQAWELSPSGAWLRVSPRKSERRRSAQATFMRRRERARRLARAH